MDANRVMLIQQMDQLSAQSCDAYYTDYLQNLKQQLMQGIVTDAYAAFELDRTWQMYCQRMQQMPQLQQPAPPQPQVMPPQFQQPAPPQPQATPPQLQQPMPQVMPQPLQQPMQPQAVPPQLQQPMPQATPPQLQQPMQPSAPPKKGGAEFTIGAVVLGVIGVLFILIAFVILGMNYMNGMVKGISMYVIAGAVLLLSELVLAKRMPKFAVGVTGLGICALYLATIVNCLYLHNFGGWIGLAVSLATAILAVLISRKKDSGVVKVISFLGCYICVFPLLTWGDGSLFGIYVSNAAAERDFLITAGILLIVDLMTILIPAKTYNVIIPIIHLAMHMLFSVVFAIGIGVMSVGAEHGVSRVYVVGYLVMAVLIHGLIYYCMERKESGSGERTGNIAAFSASGCVILFALAILAGGIKSDWQMHLVAGMLLAVCVALSILYRKGSARWIPYWMFSATLILSYDVYFSAPDDKWGRVVAVVLVLLLAKVLSRVKALRVSELLITIYVLLHSFVALSLDGTVEAMCLIGALTVFSLAALHFYKTVYESLVFAALEVFVATQFKNELTVAVMVCILVSGIVLFNIVPHFKDKYIGGLDIAVTAALTLLYLAESFAEPDLAAQLILLALGVIFILFVTGERCALRLKGRDMILMGFLVYMALIWDIPVRVLRSIILMLIAVAAVTAGFVMRKKRLRISGLVLTLLVCLKVVLWDFIGLATFDRMLLFLVVGVIALGISGIYVALEKKIV